MKEIWKPIPDYEGYYEISNTGKVKSLTRTIFCQNGKKRIIQGKEIKLNISNGYYSVHLYKNGIQKVFKIHKLVALIFIPNPENLPIVNHKDENKLNNNVDNLEWCTYEYNNNYGTVNERKSKTIKNLGPNPNTLHPVIMYNKETKEKIKIFKSLSEAHRETGIPISNISEVCRKKRKSAGGYYWEYA